MDGCVNIVGLVSETTSAGCSGTADVSHQHGKRPSDTSSLTSSAMTSLVGATDRQTSLSSAQISDPLTDLTNLSWTSLTPVHKVVHCKMSRVGQRGTNGVISCAVK